MGTIYVDRQLRDFECPSCGVKLGFSHVAEESFYIDFSVHEVFHLGRLVCNACHQPQTYLEKDGKHLFWQSSDEHVLSSYETKPVGRKDFPLGIIYAYTPFWQDENLMEFLWNSALKVLEGYRKAIVIPKKSFESGKYLYNAISQMEGVFQLCVVDDEMFEMPFGIQYPVMLAELNIQNEATKWANKRIVSFHPCFNEEFEWLKFDLDWEKAIAGLRGGGTCHSGVGYQICSNIKPVVVARQ